MLTVIIGESPLDEGCCQTGSKLYARKAVRECNIFLRQLRRQFDIEPGEACLTIQSFPYSHGVYYKVVCWYDLTDEQGTEYAYRLANEIPQKWDQESLEELAMITEG